MLNTLFESRNHFTGTIVVDVVDEADMHVGTLDYVCQFFNSFALCELSDAVFMAMHFCTTCDKGLSNIIIRGNISSLHWGGQLENYLLKSEGTILVNLSK